MTTMDFFGRQAAARRNTTTLVVLFSLAVAATVALVYALFAALFLEQGVAAGRSWRWFEPQLFAGVVAGTLAVVVACMLYKVAQLARGGAAVAQMLGGRQVSPNTTALHEKTLVNVVEEMAIASGVPIPKVYVLDQEPSINAFAAGFGTKDAAVAVTRGALDAFPRNELQGVIGHEFSHILNGDMRLNIRLMGWLAGITAISTAGYILLRSVRHVRSGGGKKGGGIAGILALGLGLLVIGAIGTLFAKLIKAAVSRQREFLADAASVQFTRHPEGIANALRRIGGYPSGSRIGNAHAQEASHFFFCNAVGDPMARWFATHPPLAERIAAIEPLSRLPQYRDAAAPAGAARAGGATPEAVVASIASPGPAHVEYGAELLRSLPMQLAVAVREPFSAHALVLAFLLERDGPTRTAQRALVQERAGPEIAHETSVLAPMVAQLPVEHRLPVLALAVGALRQLSREQFERFRGLVDALIEADARVTLPEYALRKMVMRVLGQHFAPTPPPKVVHHRIAELRRETAAVLAALAKVGHEDATRAEAAFAQGMALLAKDLGEAPAFAEVAASSLADVDAALERFVHASQGVRRQLLIAMAHVAGVDGTVRGAEGELLRAVADGLGMPIPPLLPSSPPPRV
ncbi:MAG: M48 family metallopeptidase [Planctomycetes bacterium]|nr:M48 family metallopeptidase [Planctomycetota bacterium]